MHYVGQVGERGALRAVFDKLSDGRIRWAPLPDVYDRYDFVTGTGRFIEAMGKAFPGERDAIAKYVSLVKSTARWVLPSRCAGAASSSSARRRGASTVAGDQGELAFTMPLELRVGARDAAS